ncbi:hypothetical protein [Microbacterium hominis]|uniref:Uncharacterized protein n=1 Tax=Microbacterium hominis TaxID=162426 RepID=A0A7D4UGN9_9MICO|nr:hypothetical protein [Microbacterium hominis]QKJ19929.1 hypothetical protein HQM25_11570 [Microbacterium hominis]
MGDGADRELAELRERAYGPHADIFGDSTALRRLRELEISHALDLGLDPREIPPVPASPAPADTGGAAEAPAIAAPVAQTVERVDAAPAASPPPAASRAGGQRRLMLWVTSVLVAALLAAGVTAWTLVATPAHDFTLAVTNDPDLDFPQRRSGVEVITYERFHGMQVVATTNGRLRCVWISRDLTLRPTASATSCSRDVLPTVADVTLDPQFSFIAPEAVAEFGVDTVLRFTVLDDIAYVDVAP